MTASLSSDPPASQPRELGTVRRPLGTPAPTDPQDGSSSLRSFVIETVKVLILAAAIVAPIKLFIFQPFYVKGASMEPTFADNEYLIIDKLGYRFHEPQRGDIIVFRYPRDPSQYFIKRVIGLPGEQVTIEDGTVTVHLARNGGDMTLDESYLSSDVITQGNDDVTLDANEYYVLGDNRDSSLDSRRIGSIHRSDIIGRTWLRAWPLSRISTFTAPLYGPAQSGATP
ncbi:MAG: signal peptidase I [Candidatus Kerfeldbacteria bacterium]|nr:signal peptidase I [Candidatus Kerfeldbacteria bacterium]